ncbi:hypothetical protein ACFL5A_03475, partial [Gemmatimonadota bacterium]
MRGFAPHLRIPRLGIPAGAALLLAVLLGGHTPVHAQLGAVEAFVKRVTDVSFYGTTGGLLPGSDDLRTGSYGLASWGMEFLFEIGAVTRPTPGIVPVQEDSISLHWVGSTIVRHDGRADTTNVYQIRVVPHQVPADTLWLFELGLGYGQTLGFESADPDAELRGSVRGLPSVSFYASYEPLGGYLGLRSGFLSLKELQYLDAGGNTYTGKADSFLAAALAGYFFEILGINLFVEGGYSLRLFPSLIWSGEDIPLTIPKELNL